MKNALTVDVEDWFQVSNFDAIVSRDSWDSMPSRVEQNTKRLLDLFDEFQVHGTFFVLGWVAERFPALVRDIADRGHEVASHGYGHRLVYTLKPEEFAADLRRSREVIEAASGVIPRGYRAPSFSVDRRSFWAFDVLHRENFTFDSSVFPVRHPRYGVPSFSRTPVRVITPQGATMREFPLTTLRLFGRNLGASGGGYLRIFPLAVLERAYQKMNAGGHPGCLYLHPWEIDPEQPRLRVRGLGRITHYTNLDQTERRLRTLFKAFEFGTMSESLSEAPGLNEPARSLT